jgi:hypothetical protein
MRKFRFIVIFALVLLGCTGLARADFFSGAIKPATTACEIFIITGGLLSFCFNIKK